MLDIRNFEKKKKNNTRNFGNHELFGHIYFKRNLDTFYQEPEHIMVGL